MKKLFKTLILFVAVASMASTTSCTKSPEALILGQWSFKNLTYVFPGMDDDPMTQAQIAAVEAYIESVFKGMIFDFKSNNTLEISGIQDDSFEIVGNEVVTYSIEGDQLILTSPDVTDSEKFVLDIVTLTKQKLELKISESDLDENLDYEVFLEFGR